MRKVYTPPTSGGRWYSVLLLAVFTTLLVFLVLPLTQMVSSHVQRQRELTKVDSTVMQQPTIEEPPPNEPPPEEKQEEPPPRLSDAPKPLALNFELDVALGGGGALASLAGSQFADSADALKNMAFDMSELEKQPVLLASVPPRYPRDMSSGGIEGLVVIVFLLNEQGQVEDPRVDSASRPEFEQPALEAVKKWRFKPGMREGEPVKTFMRLPMRFRMST